MWPEGQYLIIRAVNRSFQSSNGFFRSDRCYFDGSARRQPTVSKLVTKDGLLFFDEKFAVCLFQAHRRVKTCRELGCKAWNLAGNFTQLLGGIVMIRDRVRTTFNKASPAKRLR